MSRGAAANLLLARAGLLAGLLVAVAPAAQAQRFPTGGTSVTATPTGAAGGGLGGTYPSPTVDLETGKAGGNAVIGGTSSGDELVLKNTTHAATATLTLDNAGTAQSAILSGSTNDVVDLGATNTSGGTQASARLRLTNDLGYNGDFALYGSGHSNSQFANRLSINGYDAITAVQIAAAKSDAFFRIALGTGALTLPDGVEKLRLTTSTFQLSNAGTPTFDVALSTGNFRGYGTGRVDGDVGIGGAVSAGLRLYVQKATDAFMVVDQTQASTDASAQIVAQSNVGTTTADIRMYNASATGTLAGINRASTAFWYAVGAAKAVFGGHTGVPTTIVSGGAAALNFDTSQNATFVGFAQNSVTAAITASATETQGQQPLVSEYNEVSTAGANDVVTAPAAVAGRRFCVFNNSANTIQIFPASGDNVGAGVDTATTLATTKNRCWAAFDATVFEDLGGN